MFLINLLILIIFPITYLLGSNFGIEWIKFIPGTLLLYYLPGHNFNSILFYKREKVEWYIRLPLDILFSISILSIIYLILRNNLNFFELNLVSFVYIINIIFAVTAFFYDKTKIKLVNIAPKRFMQNRQLLIILVIPVTLFVVRLILNPYVYDIDSLHYFVAYNEILKTGTDNSSLFLGREAFPFLMASSHYVAGWNYIGFFKILTPLVFYITSIISLSLIRDRNSSLANLSLLTILSSPMLIIMNEEVRPETIVIAFTLPVLILTYLGIKNNNKPYILMAAFFALITFRFHELGFILLASSLIALLINVAQNVKIIKKFVSKNLVLLLVILLPYLLLLRTYSQALSIFMQDGMTAKFISITGKGLKNIIWEWWFLNDATTFVGAKIGWPGYSAIYYYLYHGIIIFLLVLFLFITYLSLKKKKGATPNYLPILPLFAFFFIHFSIAEILPRMGIVLLFDRSWPYISMTMVVSSIILIADIIRCKISDTFKKVIGIVMLFSVLSGIIGATIGSTFMGAMVSSHEKEAIRAIKNLPEGSIIISTQRNHNLVQIYGNKDFFQVENDGYTSNNFDQEIEENIDDIVKQQSKSIMDSIIINKTSKDTIKYNNTITQSDKILLETIDEGTIEDSDQKLLLLQQYYPKSFDLINQQLELIKDLPNKNIYFLYSFAKLDYGILNSRPWWRESNNVSNYQFFKNYDNKEKIVSKDKNFILIKAN